MRARARLRRSSRSEAPDGKTVADQALAYAEAFLTRWQGDPLITPAVGAALAVPVRPRDAANRARRWPTATRRRCSSTSSESPYEQKIVSERYGKTSTELLRDARAAAQGRSSATTASG